MIWLIVIAVVVVVVVAVLAPDHPAVPEDDASREVIVTLHAIHRRIEGAQLRSEIRRDAAQVLRELRDELDGQCGNGQGKG